MNLTIDIGNTCAKLVVYEGNTPIYEEVSKDQLEESIQSVCSRFHPEQCAWCSVSGNDEETRSILSRLECPVIQLTGTSQVPLNVCYQSKATLGPDRLAAVIGATTLMPDTDLLIIDAGTCITYDLVDAQGNYLGGNISPGVKMRFKALKQFTARLPYIETNGYIPEIGINTETAIRCGVFKGITYEIEGYIHELREKYPHLRVYLTGGNLTGEDKLSFSEKICKHFLTDSHLVSRGLNRLLGYQLSENK